MTDRLSAVTVARAAPTVARPAYDWAAQDIGIVHLGLGAFHRAHQAVYTDAAMAAGDRDWRIAGASLRSRAVADTLAPQDGLYSVTERGPAGERAAIIGSIAAVVVASERPSDLAALLARPGVHIVTLTVTEKAYARGADGDLDTDAVAASGGTIYHHIAAGLAARRAAGLGGVTLLSCDNLADNGGVLARGLTAWLDRVDPTLCRWFEAECTCPATMVDRIVPAVSASDLERVAGTLGLHDAGAVVTEPFRQWVIEDRFAGPRPRWEQAGAQIVADVAPYEAAKLRMLNGAHSALAYLGLLVGHAYVHEAIADVSIRPIVERLMRIEAANSLQPAALQDLGAYADALLGRFANAALPHRLAQIAVDGSQKIPQRWLEPLAINAGRGRRSPATLHALAAWIIHVRGIGVPVSDPLADRLAAAWRSAGRDGIVAALFANGGIIGGPWRPDADDAATLRQALEALG